MEKDFNTLKKALDNANKAFPDQTEVAASLITAGEIIEKLEAKAIALENKSKSYTEEASYVDLDLKKKNIKLKNQIRALEYELYRQETNESKIAKLKEDNTNLEDQKNLLVDLVRTKMLIIEDLEKKIGQLEYMLKKRTVNTDELEELRDEIARRDRLIEELEENRNESRLLQDFQLRMNKMEQETNNQNIYIKQLKKQLQESTEKIVELKKGNDFSKEFQLKLNEMEKQTIDQSLLIQKLQQQVVLASEKVLEYEKVIEDLKKGGKPEFSKELSQYDTLDKVNNSIKLRTTRLMNLAKEIQFNLKGKKTKLSDVPIFDMDATIEKLMQVYQKDKKYEVELSDLKTIKKALKKIQKLEQYRQQRFNV